MRKSARTQIPPFFDNDPYRYGKLQKLETRNDCHSYIDQVKGVISIHVDKNGAIYIYLWNKETQQTKI